MFAEEDDILQFTLSNRSGVEVPYSFGICGYDIDDEGDSVEILEGDYQIERDFHRFNVVKSDNDDLESVNAQHHYSRSQYAARPKSSLVEFVYVEEDLPEEDYVDEE